ncbi:PilZ domain-containing protein [Myxococcota bacterium]
MTGTGLLKAFEKLNEKKRADTDGLSTEESARWRELRNQIERALFQFIPHPQAERRESLRVPVLLSARYWTRNELKDRYIPSLGDGGLFISCPDPLPVGTKFDLVIGLISTDFQIQVLGEVTWVDLGESSARRGMGVKFADMSYEQKAAVYNLVNDSVRGALLERRQHTRLDSRLPIKVMFAEKTIESATCDLSVGGVFVGTDYPALIGEWVKVLLDLPGQPEPFRAIAQVVRVVDLPVEGPEEGFGLSFVMLIPDGEELIKGYMLQRVEGQHIPDEEEPKFRLQPRIKRRIPVNYHHEKGGSMSYCRDLSQSGIFIQTHEPPPASTGPAWECAASAPVASGPARWDWSGRRDPRPIR